VPDVDLMIVGSGPIGATFARLVAETRPDSSIVMVDLGPQLTDPPGVNVRNLPGEERERARLDSQGPDRDRRHDLESYVAGDAPLPGTHFARAGGLPGAAMSSCVGGMGAHWTCLTPRPRDTECLPFISDADWEKAVATAERLLCVNHEIPESASAQVIRSILSRVFQPILPRGRVVETLPMAVQLPDGGQGPVRWTGVDTILGPISGLLSPSGSFELRSDTICRSLSLSGERITGAQLEHLPTGEREQLCARVVVVAADSLRTPQLLWASEIRPRALGRYLMDHPRIIARIAVDPDLLHGLETVHEQSLHAVTGIPFADPDHPFIGGVLVEALSDIANRGDRGNVASMGWACRTRPQRENRIAFDDEPDWCGMPRMRIDFALSEADTSEIERGQQLLETAAAALGEYLPRWEPRIATLGETLHYQGTFRIGEHDDGTSVCDVRSRVWGVENLFLGGNGIIPNATACNPTLTSVALAAHALEALSEALG
jgi:pyranose oxidase